MTPTPDHLFVPKPFGRGGGGGGHIKCLSETLLLYGSNLHYREGLVHNFHNFQWSSRGHVCYTLSAFNNTIHNFQ